MTTDTTDKSDASETRTAVLYVSPTHRRAVRMAAALEGIKIGEFAERLVEGNEAALASVANCYALACKA
jgi:hypothetical protein